MKQHDFSLLVQSDGIRRVQVDSFGNEWVVTVWRKGMMGDIPLTILTARGDVRFWKSADSLVRWVRECGWNGDVVFRLGEGR